MPARYIVPIACAVLALGLAACGGGGKGGGSSSHALGEKVVVEHTEISGGANAPTTTLGITVLKVRKGTQQELKDAGFEVDAEHRSATPYYVDVSYENQGKQAIKRSLDVALEDQDSNLITATTIFNFGGRKFAKCPQINEGEVVPGASYKSCTLFLVPKGKKPSKVSFLPNTPGHETQFVYWAVA